MEPTRIAPAVPSTLRISTPAAGEVAPRPVSNTPKAAPGKALDLIGVAPDATEQGPLAVTSSEYKFDAVVDPDILSDRKTELWARVYRPAQMGAGKHPVLVFLHGNHGTCGRGTGPQGRGGATRKTGATPP